LSEIRLARLRLARLVLYRSRCSRPRRRLTCSHLRRRSSRQHHRSSCKRSLRFSNSRQREVRRGPEASGFTRVSMAGFGCPTGISTRTKAQPTTPTRILMCITRAMDGCGWRHPGFGVGARIPTLASVVRWDLAGMLACIEPAMAGADTGVAATAAAGGSAAVATELRPTIGLLADPARVREAVRTEDSLVTADSVAATAADIADGNSGGRW
jgi:hypothetical protein